jgi:hypothetical protein
MHNNSNFYKNATKLFKKNDQQSDAISGGTNLYPTSYYYRNHLKPIKIKIHRTNGPKWLPPPSLLSFLLRFLFFLILQRVRFFVFQRRRQVTTLIVLISTYLGKPVLR